MYYLLFGYADLMETETAQEEEMLPTLYDNMTEEVDMDVVQGDSNRK